MKKLALMLGLGLFLLLAACNQNPNTDLGAQGIEYGQVRFGVVSDYLEGAEETNFNGQWDRGEFLVPNVELRFTPVNEDGKPIGEAVSYFTSQAATPEEAVTFKLPAGIYQPEVVLPTNLRGGDDYAWKPVGPIIKLPPFKLDPKLLLDREYTVACGVGRKWVSISSGIEFESSPCYFSGGGSDDGLYVSANPLTTPCDARSADVAVSVAYKSTPTPVTLSASNLPAGMISTFNPATTTTSSILTLDVSGVEAGDYTITVQDSRGVSVPVNVRVRGVTVNFADANLGAAVRGALNIPAPTPICAYDMLALTHLDYDDNVYQIEGLQYAKNLEDLGAAGFYHTDVTALTGLRKLARLRLVRSHINIDQLSRLQSLKEL